MSNFRKIITIFLTAGLLLANLGVPVFAESNREIRGIRKVLIMPQGQVARGVEISKQLGVGEVADGIPPALKGRVSEDMLPYVFEEIIYQDETLTVDIPEEIQKALEKTGADIAEYYPVLDEGVEAGDLVSILDKKELLLNTETKYLVEKSGKAYDSKLLGVISGNAAVIINSGGSDAKPKQILRPVALVGRAPVKVNLQNGPISIGDYLTSSDIPGVAMKAVETGKAIGMALESFPREGQDPSASSGQVMVFINIGWYHNSPNASTTDVMLSGGFFEKLWDAITGLPKLIVNGILEVKNDVIAHGVFKNIVKVARTVVEGRTIAYDNAASLAENSQLEVVGEDADSLSFVTYSIVSPRKEIMVSGSGRLLVTSEVSSSTSEVGVEAKIAFHPYFSAIISTSTPIRVVVTPTSYINGNLYVAEKSIYGFTIKEINSQDAGAEFDWILTARLTDLEAAQAVLNSTSTIATQEVSGSPTSQTSGNQEVGLPNIESVYQNGDNQPCSTEIGACQIGVQIYYDGAWGECMGAVFPTAELCDGVDNNCDGIIDDGVCDGSPTPIIEPIVETASTTESIATSSEPIVESATTSTESTATSTVMN